METKEKKNRARSSGNESFKDKVNEWIAKSPKLEKFVENTSYFIKHPDEFTNKVNEIYNRATNKNETLALSDFAGKIKSFYRMSKMALSGEYNEVPKGQVFLAFGALIYLISPVDIAPDFLGFLGIAGEAALLTWLVKFAADEIEKFEKWEAGQGFKSVNPAY